MDNKDKNYYVSPELTTVLFSTSVGMLQGSNEGITDDPIQQW